MPVIIFVALIPILGFTNGNCVLAISTVYSVQDSNFMNTRETVATMCVAGIAMAVLSIAFVLPFQAREGVSAQYGGGAITGGSMTGGSTNATMGTNATTSGGGATAGGGGNQSAVSEATMHINEAMSAAQSGDMQGVMMHLRLALNV